MKLKLSLIISILLLSVSISFADALCDAAMGKNAIFEVNKNLLKTIGNMAPIKFGSMELLSADELPKTTESVSPDLICFCPKGPITLPGLAISFWNNVGIVETTSVPYCFPSLSLGLNLGIGADKSYGERSSSRRGDNKISAQTHFMTANLLALVNAGLYAICGGGTGIPSTGIDHMSEVYPWWQNDIWAAIFAPDSILVANPIAQAACFADSIASVINKPLDFLYWCYGTWGGSYPNTVTVGSGDAISSYALLATRTVASMFKTMQLMLTTGPHMYKGACQPIPTILIKKSVVNIYPIYPVLQEDRQSIGASNFQWGVGQDMPIKNKGVMVWAVYMKRDCCAL